MNKTKVFNKQYMRKGTEVVEHGVNPRQEMEAQFFWNEPHRETRRSQVALVASKKAPTFQFILRNKRIRGRTRASNRSNSIQGNKLLRQQMYLEVGQ